MTPLLPILAGLISFAIGAAILRSLGPGYRVGRLLAATPGVTIAEAVAMARAGRPERYVKLSGRIDAEAEFEDDAHRPLVFRRTRLDLRVKNAWRSLDDRREAVPFEVREGLDGIAVHHQDLDAGLVVLPRVSLGTAAEAPDSLPAGTDPAATVRLLVQLVSTVEHAIVLGVPTLDASGSPQLAAGLGRPLILTTLETGEAMRILAGDHPRRPLAVAVSLVVGLVLVAIGLGWAVVDAFQ